MSLLKFSFCIDGIFIKFNKVPRFQINFISWRMVECFYYFEWLFSVYKQSYLITDEIAGMEVLYACKKIIFTGF